MPSNERSPEYGTLQRLIDGLYRNARTITQLDLIVGAEANDLCADLREICALVPPGSYTRHRLCTQLNSSLSARGWGFFYGTVE